MRNTFVKLLSLLMALALLVPGLGIAEEPDAAPVTDAAPVADGEAAETIEPAEAAEPVEAVEPDDEPDEAEIAVDAVDEVVEEADEISLEAGDADIVLASEEIVEETVSSEAYAAEAADDGSVVFSDLPKPLQDCLSKYENGWDEEFNNIYINMGEDGILTPEEMASVTYLTFPQNKDTPSMKQEDLHWLSFFPNLESLFFRMNWDEKVYGYEDSVMDFSEVSLPKLERIELRNQDNLEALKMGDNALVNLILTANYKLLSFEGDVSKF